MNILYRYNGKNSLVENVDQKSFFLSNKHGGFFSYSLNFTKFQGWIDFANSHIKLVDEISYENYYDYSKISDVVYDYDRYTIVYKEKSLKFELYENGLKVNPSNKNPIYIDLDIRYLNEVLGMGRIYSIEKINDSLIINYQRFNDNSLKEKKYQIFLVIKGIENINELNTNWLEKNYTYDSRRGSESKFYIYRISNVIANSIVISYDFDKNIALDKANYLYHENLESNYRNKLPDFNFNKINNKKTILSNFYELSYVNAYDGLRKLIFKKHNSWAYAGFWWFYQVWTRDLLISLPAIKEQNNSIFKEILFNLEQYLDETGLDNIIDLEERKIVYDINGEEIISKTYHPKNADALGWYSYSLLEYIKDVKEKGKEFDFNFLKKIYFKLTQFVSNLLEKNTKSQYKYLIYNGSQKTWMDTISRSGYRIEIQSLLIKVYELLIELSKILERENSKLNFERLKDKTISEINKHFVIDDLIQDGFTINLNNNSNNDSNLNNSKNDSRIYEKYARPNLFLAYFLTPNLFSKKIWEKSFDYVLSELFVTHNVKIKEDVVKLGLIATISKDVAIKYHTGENDDSYHQGDSWYFINNFIALGLLNFNFKKYEKYVFQLLDSSVYNNIFTSATSTEITSLSQIEPYGCFNQLWSNATLLLLLQKLNS